MKTITLSEFEIMAKKLAENFVDVENYYVQVMKWKSNDKPQFDATFYFKGFNAGGSAYTPEIALELAEKQYETRIKELEVTINY
jgi:predicted enzyme related to lactoylglutathione lyase